jgi:hypothetical protein
VVEPLATNRWIELPMLFVARNDALDWNRPGHGAESGVPIDMELAHINTIEGGKLCRIEEYTDRADGLKAAGLSE